MCDSEKRNRPIKDRNRESTTPGKIGSEKTRDDRYDDSPLVAAYESGRSLNQLDWHLQQAWLLPVLDFDEAERHSLAVHAILTGLPAQLHRALPVTSQERFHDYCLNRRDEWERLYGSPGHLTEVQSKAKFIRHELLQEDECSPSLLREEWWLDALRSVEGFAPNLYQTVEGELDERSKLSLRLGRWIDRGVHPRAVFRHMCWSLKTSPVIPSLDGKSLWDIPDDVIPAHTSAPSLNLEPAVLYPFVAGTTPPELGWFDELQRYWDEMGIPTPCPASFPESEDEANDAKEVTGIFKYITNLDKLVRDELAALPPQVKIPPTKRTKPMSLRQAAKRMGYEDSKGGAERLRKAIDDGSILCEKLNRQSFIFSKQDFPEAVWKKIT